jgi:PAS domain S-box-containing protein
MNACHSVFVLYLSKQSNDMASLDDFDQNRFDKSVLIVDDISVNLQLLSAIISAEGYAVILASSGMEAMQIVQSKTVSIILLDIRMPEMDGFEFCRLLKADPQIQDIPVIFISAFSDEQSIITGFQVGGVDFISKPFRKEEILARLRNHLHLADLRSQLLVQKIELENLNEKLQVRIDLGKQNEDLLEKQIVSLTKPVDSDKDVRFPDLFDMIEIQKLQDQFAQAFGVASIITYPNGSPITNPSNFCRLCKDIIRKTEKGKSNCIYSDSVLGIPNLNGPTIQTCLSGGLWDAGSSITMGGVHIANWLIGQVRDQAQNEEKIRLYAREIGANEEDAVQAFSEVTPMSEERFKLISEMLHTMTRQLSQLAYQNIQQARYIDDRKQALELLAQSEEQYRTTLFGIGEGVITVDRDCRVKLMNKVAEELTGWTQQEAVGLLLEEIFLIVNENTREKVDSPVRKVLSNGNIVGLANHTILVSKTGAEIPVADSAAPIRNGVGEMIGVVLVFRDQTVEWLADKALKESEDKFRNLADSSPAVIGIYQDDYWVYVNPSAERMSGFTLEELYKKKYWEIVAPEYRTLIQKNGQERLSGGGNQNSYEFKILNKDGAEKWAFLSGSSIIYKDRPAGIISIIDITEKKKAEKDALEERKLLRTLIDNLPDTIYVKDQYCRKIIANPADLYVIGCESESEVIGKTDLELFSDEIGLRGHLDDLRVIQRGEAVLNREEAFYNAEGKKRWLLTSKIPIFDNEGNSSGLVGIGRDITKIKNAEEQILKLSMSIEQSPSTIVITDLNGNIEYVNPKFTEVTGYSAEEAIGQNPRILSSGQMSVAVYQELWNTISSGGIWRGEFLNKKKNGELYWEWATMTSIKNEEDEIINYIAIKEDISARKQMEAELLVAKNKAEESDRLKSAFLANMSHEIRTPLNSIIGFSELLADSHFEIEEKDEFIEHIISNGNSLLNIISDIMDISKMESGMVRLRICKVPVNQIVNEIRKQYFVRFEEKGIDFQLEFDPEFDPVQIMADPERLNQIFNNLISNALKFTVKGFVRLRFSRAGNMLQFEVKDSGIGIPADFHDKIFDRFSQVESSNARRFGGNGLGLAITKNLIELMGGQIWLESEPGVGTSFYFTLPLNDRESIIA